MWLSSPRTQARRQLRPFISKISVIVVIFRGEYWNSGVACHPNRIKLSSSAGLKELHVPALAGDDPCYIDQVSLSGQNVGDNRVGSSATATMKLPRQFPGWCLSLRGGASLKNAELTIKFPTLRWAHTQRSHRLYGVNDRDKRSKKLIDWELAWEKPSSKKLTEINFDRQTSKWYSGIIRYYQDLHSPIKVLEIHGDYTDDLHSSRKSNLPTQIKFSICKTIF